VIAEPWDEAELPDDDETEYVVVDEIDYTDDEPGPRPQQPRLKERFTRQSPIALSAGAAGLLLRVADRVIVRPATRLGRRARGHDDV